jgi:2-dehydro-3-deoxyglucarate aldolase/4-hydroxy-2-oxoheptanedioate aldolase
VAALPIAPVGSSGPLRGDLRRRVLAGEPALGIFLSSGDPLFAEICARAGFDWVLADLEHGAGSEADLVGQFQAIQGAGASALVRVAAATRIGIGRALDLGAEGIMVPRVESAEEVARIVPWLRYPPDGERGVALFTRGTDLGRVPHAAVGDVNERILGVLQVENRGALADARTIAALDGVDVLFVGPTDLSHALRIPGDLDHVDFRGAVREVAQAAEGAGKAAGVLVREPTDLDRYLEEGYRFFGISSDGSILDRAARAAVARGRELLARSPT